MQINKVCVIGAGVMGAGIAALIASSKTEVLLLDIIPNMTKPQNKDNSTMINIIISNEDKFCPELFQIIDNIDGTYQCQHLASVDNGNGHRAIFEETVSLHVCGLMTIAPFEDDPERVRQYFRELRGLRNEIVLKELSMGMSNDFEIAIEEGATMIRVGSALFGKRST